ncbi:hypothetical protein SAMN06265222_10955 [Neorhodopirellula lusitana]|uniref:N-acetyltransferase domain-containing protein n=1 Tax=Neorhodopirellula lusitana TaxID=445327 RepID=A0ABY1QEK2_9BACT|nr:hypothetical protein SAMN06265222_10955 [Neorhodopirellula lusitana]
MPPTSSLLSLPNNQDIYVWELPVAELAAVLNDFLGRLSPTRVSIVTDQLRAILRAEGQQELVVLAASAGAANLDAAVVLIATIAKPGDTATVLHMDWTRPASSGDAEIAQDRETAQGCALAIAQRLTPIFSAHDVRFIQWATDPEETTSHSVSSDADQSVFAWPRRTGFSPIGTLDYLAMDYPTAGNPTAETRVDLEGEATVVIEPLASDSPSVVADFEQVIQRTYQGSLDCPQLEEYRAPAEIIQSYRNVDSYAPDLWFWVRAAGNDDSSCGEVVGCMMLAKHCNSTTNDLVLELVYMGVLPEHRGRRYGQQIMQQIAQVCIKENASRLVLAVDQRNHPAHAAYRRSGMQSLFRETVWVHSNQPASLG